MHGSDRHNSKSSDGGTAVGGEAGSDRASHRPFDNSVTLRLCDIESITGAGLRGRAMLFVGCVACGWCMCYSRRLYSSISFGLLVVAYFFVFFRFVCHVDRFT